MLDMSRWTVMASLFCSISLFGSAYDAVHSTVTFAGIGNPQAVQGSLGALVGRMGGELAPVAVAEVNGTVVAMAKRPAAPTWDGAIDWALQTGKSKALPANNANAVGLPPGLPVMQKGWQDDDGTRHFVQVSTQNSHTDVLLTVQNSAVTSGYYYLTDRTGTLRAAAYIAADGSITRIPVADAKDNFDAQKAYWMNMAFPPAPAVTAANSTGTN